MSGSGGALNSSSYTISLDRKTLSPSSFLFQGDPGPRGEPGTRGPPGEAGPEVEYCPIVPEQMLQLLPLPPTLLRAAPVLL